MENPIYEITRSAERTIQIQQFQPYKAWACEKQVFYKMPSEEEEKLIGEKLQQKCNNAVNGQIKDYLDNLNNKTIRENPGY